MTQNLFNTRKKSVSKIKKMIDNRIIGKIIISLILCTSINAFAVNDSIVEQRLSKIEHSIRKLNADISRNKSTIVKLERFNSTTSNMIDSVSNDLNKTNLNIAEISSDIKTTVNETDSRLQESISRANESISQRTTFLGIAITFVIVLVCICLWYLRNRLIKKDDTIESISTAQKALQKTQAELLTAHQKLSEESLHLDNKLIELLEKQINKPEPKSSTEIDHSLALKIADEITRIEVNLSRMDSSIRGYKQLSKALERIRETYASKGYEITKLIGEKYVEGMKVIADFVVNEELPEGSQIITNVRKPQILYNGTLFQAAEITVSQNI